jgi:hypothetical protein
MNHGLHGLERILDLQEHEKHPLLGLVRIKDWSQARMALFGAGKNGS